MRAEPQGRPRDADIDSAILKASLDEISEVGYANASIAGIARRASVPRSTVYRRWSSKDELVIEAIKLLGQESPSKLTGRARDDLSNEMLALVEGWGDSRTSVIRLSILAEVSRNPELYSVWRQQMLAGFEQRINAIVEHGITTRQLRKDVDVDLLIEMMLALPLHVAFRPSRPDLARLASRFIDTLFAGLEAT